MGLVYRSKVKEQRDNSLLSFYCLKRSLLKKCTGRVSVYSIKREDDKVYSQTFEECIKACLDCMKACNVCYDACLGEEDVQMMTDCIRLDRECADFCALAARSMQSNSPFVRQICILCADICEACGNECKKHGHTHCQRCADACFKCAEECRKMAS
jgi:Domain of Unknown Function (DUF326)